MQLADYLHSLDLAVALAAVETRATDRMSACPICGAAVAVVQDRVPRLTSNATVYRWIDRIPATHSPECWAEHRGRVDDAAAKLGDLWSA